MLLHTHSVENHSILSHLITFLLTSSIYKSWNIAFIVTMLLLSHIIYLFPTFPLSFLTTFFLINFLPYIYISSNISSSLLHFHLTTTLYLNVIIPPSLHHHFILTLLLLILFTIPFNSIFSHTKRWILSLSQFWF